MASTQPEPKSSFIGDWRPADVSYARALMLRGLLDPHRISWRDPTCLECGHRAWDHGLENLPMQEQLRWFREEPTACKWKRCDCKIWRPNLHAKTMVEFAGQVRVSDAWVEVPLGRSWIVAYRIVNDHGTPVVGELRIFPAEEDRPALGQWSGELLGANAKVPRRGITTRQLRAVRVLAYLRYMADQVARLRAKAPDLAKDWGWGEGGATPARRSKSPVGSRRGRKGRPDEFYADIAAAYVLTLARDSKRPIQDIATRRRLDPGQVRDMIREARKRKLLTAAKAGVRGGVLTPAGMAFFPEGERLAITLLSDAPVRQDVNRKAGARIGP